ncbi:MAG: branched-chain amino acid ABC transporter substrate-binding protein [Dehalococcoidia bacterium]
MSFTLSIAQWWRFRLVTLFSLVGILALVASACGDDDDDVGTAAEKAGGDVPSTEDVGDADETSAERDDDEPTGGGPGIRIPEGEPIIIGLSLPLTGGAAARGTNSRDGALVGAELWKQENGEQIAGRDIEFVVEDDGCSDAATAIVAAERLVDIPTLVGILGPLCDGGTQAVIPLYTESGIPMISGSASQTDLTTTQPEAKFFFRTVFKNAAEGLVQATYAVETLGAETAYVIDDTEAYGEDLANTAQEELEVAGVTVTREQIAIGDTDFSALASRIADDNPDVVVFEGFNPEGQLLATALDDAGYEGVFMSGDGVAEQGNFIDANPEVAEGAVFAGCAGFYTDDFTQRFNDLIGADPDTPFPQNYADAAYIMLTAINEVATEDGGDVVINTGELRDAISGAQHDGFTGAIAFDENGDRVGETAEELGIVLCEVQGNAFVVIEQ